MAPQAMGMRMVTTVPSFKGGSRNQSVLVGHREYLGDITSSTTFSATSVAINPGNAGMFPWLSFFAMGYESYRFRKLRFLTIPISSAQKDGQVFLAVDYDAADSAPVSKVEVYQYKGAQSAPAWCPCESVCDPIDENALGRQRYMRFGALASNLDIKTYDVGNLIVGSANFAAAAVCASVFVEYECEFYTPQYSMSAFAQAFSARITAAGSVSKTALYGTAATVGGGLDVTASGNTITFNRPGQYLVEQRVTGTGLAAGTNPSLSGTAAADALSEAVFVNSTTNGLLSTIVNVYEKGQTLITDWSAAATTISAAWARVSPYLYSLL